MKIKYFLMAAVVALMTACGTASKVPLTGRTHRISISDAQLLSLSNQEYTKFMASAKRSTDAKNTEAKKLRIRNTDTMCTTR